MDLEFERFENRLRTVQLGLEILTSVFATLPDSEIPPEGDNGEEDEGGIEMAVVARELAGDRPLKDFGIMKVIAQQTVAAADYR